MLTTMSHTKRAVLVFILYVVVVTFAGWSLVSLAAQAQPEADDSADGGNPARSTADPPVGEADTGSERGPDASESPSDGEDDGTLVVLGKGDTAPSSGILVSGSRFGDLKMAELKVNDAEYRARTEKQTREDLTVVLQSCLQAEDDEGGFFTSFWGGVAIGVSAAIVVGWLGYKIMDQGD